MPTPPSQSTIGYTGATGAHSHAAVQQYLAAMHSTSYPQHPLFNKLQGSAAGSSASALGHASEAALFAAVASGTCPLALVPVENTHSGTFTQVYDLLAAYAGRVHVVGEWVCAQSNALMVAEGSTIVASGASVTGLDVVVSHQHVLDQCKGFLDGMEKSGGRVEVRAMHDTGAAAQWLAAHASTNKSTAVIANPLAAKAHGLRIIRENVGDDQRAVTRYLLLSGHALTTAQLQMGAVAVGNKTTLTVALKNVPGALFKALSCFAFRDLNITKLESRPSPRATSSLPSHGTPWEYLNYVDIEGGMEEERVQKAVAELNEWSTSVCVLGSYPKFAGGVEVGVGHNGAMSTGIVGG